jgi:hypothetical protein
MKTVGKQKKVTLEELLVFSLATADALVELLIEKGILKESEFIHKLSAERKRYQRLLRQAWKGTNK